MTPAADYRLRGIPFPVFRRFRSKALASGLSVRDALILCMTRYSEDQSLVDSLKASHAELQQAIHVIALGGSDVDR